MQFAYQFPERCERLVLVSSGGLGREVHLLLRAAALPGADWVLPVLTSRGVRGLGRGVGGLLRRGADRARAATSEVLAQRLRVARQRGLASGVPAHGALGDRHPAASASAPTTACTSPR